MCFFNRVHAALHDVAAWVGAAKAVIAVAVGHGGGDDVASAVFQCDRDATQRRVRRGQIAVLVLVHVYGAGNGRADYVFNKVVVR